MKSVLFVCLGNICRSPMAEAILIDKAAKLGLELTVDSAGTYGGHAGNWPDPRTIRVLKSHGLKAASRSRLIQPEDFQKFDYIIVMDEENLRDVSRLPGAIPSKISRMLDWNPDSGLKNVPDPYHGQPSDFESLYDLLDSAINRFTVVISRP